MRIATVGKGGSGKTTVVGTLTRILAESGIKVLAIDGDPNPNLALTLGIDRDATSRIRSIPTNIMTLKKDAEGNVLKLADGTSRLEMTISQDTLIDQFAAQAPENIKLVIIGAPPEGSAGSGCMCASHRAVRGLITEMTDYGEHTITDMEAGLEHLKRGTARNVDMMLIVAEPY
ncbi:MAG: AAA family ATPase, partial [Paracoccaceae bacterium]